MKTISIIGGNKGFNSYLQKILNISEIDCKYFTKYAVKKEQCYDYVIFNSNSNIKDIWLNGSYCFVNMDLVNNSKNVNVYGNIITYGLGSKNTVTVSSMKDNNSFVYCLQRDLNYNAFGKLEPAEIPINISFSGEDEIYAAIVAITISLIEGKNLSTLIRRKKLTVLT
ncbi:hypothetical protein [Clostridium thailandense]|uniref:hypothetical protein n=1 Tax=Clostridium thailandense TaxID=2794346 RepID=UPI00398A2CC3